MRNNNIKFIIIVSILLSCQEIATGPEDQSTELSQLPPPPAPHPAWVDSGKVHLRLDSNLNHNDGGFLVDSVLQISYRGYDGEIIYEFLNEEGKWLDSIYSVKRLPDYKIKEIHELFGSTKFSDTDFQLCCYDPNIGLAFFKNGDVIAYSSISIRDHKIRTTSVLGTGIHSAAIDTILLKDFKELFESTQ